MSGKRKCPVSLVFALLLAVLVNISSAQTPGVIVGTFDSRCVAAAYYRSAVFMDEVNAQKEEFNAAVEAGDTELAETLSTDGEESQQLAHERVFSTGDIEEIIWLIWSDLPGVAEETGVNVIVSVWDIAYRDDDIRFVDVTDELVSFFDPTGETLELVEQIKSIPAIPAPMLPEGNH